jgi:hypothetical protein
MVIIPCGCSVSQLFMYVTLKETSVYYGTNTISVHLQHMHPGHAALAIAGLPTAAVPHPHLAASPVLGSPLANSTGSPVSTVSVGGTGGQASTHTTPCSTLFVANLGPFCSEQELKDLFSRYCCLCVCYLVTLSISSGLSTHLASPRWLLDPCVSR